MASEALRQNGGRRAVILAAAALTLLLGLGALVLPVAKDLPGGMLVGWLLLVAGLAELAAAGARWPDPARNAALAADVEAAAPRTTKRCRLTCSRAGNPPDRASP